MNSQLRTDTVNESNERLFITRDIRGSIEMDCNSSTECRPVRPQPLPRDREELEIELFRSRDEFIALRARLAQSEIEVKRLRESATLKYFTSPTEHLDYLEGLVKDLEFQILELKKSTTWRIGRFIMSPIRLLKRG